MEFKDAKETIEVIARWLAVREASGYRVPKGSQDFKTEATHSLRGGLLNRLLVQGKEPLEKCPPCHLSRPWYALVDNGQATTFEVCSMGALFHPPESVKVGDAVIVGQNATWRLEEILVEDSVWLISHENVGLCKASKVSQTDPTHGFDTSYWLIERVVSKEVSPGSAADAVAND